MRRLQFVGRAKAFWFTLPEIRELLALSHQAEEDMATLKATDLQKLADVDARIPELSRIRQGLRALVNACPGHGTMTSCPIFNALIEESA